MPTANDRAKNNEKPAVQPQKTAGGHSIFMWLSRFFSLVCFGLVTTLTVFALSLLHLTKEAEVDALLVSAPTYSENLAYFEPLHVDMPAMDILAEMFVRQFISASNTIYTNLAEQRRLWGPTGIVSYMSTPAVYNAFWKRVSGAYFDGEHEPAMMVEADIRQILKEGWNSWQIFFDTRRMDTSISEPIIEHWIATIQFRYYPYNAVMFRRLRNPLGFTVTQYHLAYQKK